MKYLAILFTLLGFTLQLTHAQTPHAQNAREHFFVSPDSRNAEVLTFLTYTLVVNGEFVTRVGGSGTADWSNTYDIDGQTFRPWGAIHIGNQIALYGNINGGPCNSVVMIDYNGQSQWAKQYSMRIDHMIESINGNIILAATDNGHQHLEYLLVEVDPMNGNLIHHERTGIPDFPHAYGDIKDIAHNGVWYLAIIEASGVTISITSDVNLVPDKVVRHESNQLQQVDIREIKRSVAGDFYVTGLDAGNNQFFCGKMSINQWFTDMRRIKFGNPNYECDLSNNGPISVESPNRRPYYLGGSWGSITLIPNNAAFNFVGIARDRNTGFSKAVLVQYDQGWNLNYSEVFDYGLSVGQPNLVKRYNQQLIMVTTVDNGTSSRLIENRLADDFIGCFSSTEWVEEGELEISNNVIPHTVEEDEFMVEEKDLNYYGNYVLSDAACPSNKRESPIASEMEEEEIRITAYPNPSQGTFTLAGIENTKVEVTDLTGRVIKSFPAHNATEYDVTGLATGTYIIRAERDGGMKHLKVVVL